MISRINLPLSFDDMTNLVKHHENVQPPWVGLLQHTLDVVLKVLI